MTAGETRGASEVPSYTPVAAAPIADFLILDLTYYAQYRVEKRADVFVAMDIHLCWSAAAYDLAALITEIVPTLLQDRRA